MNFTKPPAASQLMRKRLRNYIMTPFDDPSTFVRESRRTPVQGVCRNKAVWHLPARRDLPHCVRHIPCRSPRDLRKNPSLSGIWAVGPHPCPACGGALQMKKENQRRASSTLIFFFSFAEREGFEPPEPFSSTVFKTAVIDHSTISPVFQSDFAGALRRGFFRNGLQRY